MKVKETNEAIDTTIEEEANKEGIFNEETIYSPMLVVVGEGWVLKALDDSLIGLQIGKQEVIEISPEEAFGLRDQRLVKTILARKLKDKNIIPGARVEVNGKIATVRTIGAGRVRVDFNPPLAGKTLVYDLHIKKNLKRKKDKLKALINRRIPSVEVQKFKLNLRKNLFRIILPIEALFVEGIQYTKRGLANDVQKYFPDIDTVTFLETFKKESPQKTDEESLEQDASHEDS
jgi:FKBP-type peptidyl-prolyl cis-trans isomerase 2